MATRLSDRFTLVLQLASATTRTSIVPIPVACTLVQAMVAVDSAPTTASLALTKTNGHVLASAKDLSALTANTGSDMTLATGAPSKTLHLDKGDCIIAVNTISSAASMTDCTLTLVLEPDLT